MCVVSNIGQGGMDMWPKPFGDPPPKAPNPFIPWAQPIPDPLKDYQDMIQRGQTVVTPPYSGPTKEQFEEFLKLMRAAKRFDTLVGMKDCEQAEKVEWLKAIGNYLGVDVSDLAK